jgi:hypothetical protein
MTCKSTFRLAASLFFLIPSLFAHDAVTTKLTWAREISRIVQKRCVACHHKEPVDLTSYESARPWAKAIKDEVLNRRMPPWGAVKGFGEFRNDMGLSQEEIMTLADWVEGGAPEGDPALLPPDRIPELDSGLKRKGIRVNTLAVPITIAGIRPLASAGDVKITAERPDGSVEPLLWLRDYDAKWKRTFLYRKPVSLGKGTRIIADPPIAFEVIPAPTRAR